jgi:ATP-dependent Lon protease
MGEGGSGEGQMIRTYLDWLISVPWGKRSDEISTRSRRARC